MVVVDPGADSDDELGILTRQLEDSASLALDERFALLRRTEERIAHHLEGLDGL